MAQPDDRAPPNTGSSVQNGKTSINRKKIWRKLVTTIIILLSSVAFYKFFIPHTVNHAFGSGFSFLFSLVLLTLAYSFPVTRKSFGYLVYQGLLFGLAAGLMAHTMLLAFLYGPSSLTPVSGEGIVSFLARFLMVQMALLTPMFGVFALVVLRLVETQKSADD